MQSALNVYPSHVLHEAAHALAANEENENEHGEHIDLSEPRPSKILLIDDVFPEYKKGDIFLVYGEFTRPHRHVVHISKEEFRNAPVNVIQSEIARIYEKLGYADLEVFIVPEGGLKPPPYKEGSHFSICSDTDYYYSLLTPEQREQMTSPYKQREAEKLLDALENLKPIKLDVHIHVH